MFGNPPNIQKLIEKKDIRGLGKALMSDKKGDKWNKAREESLVGLTALAKTNDQALEAIIEAVHHDYEDYDSMRGKIILQLGEISHPRSVDALIPLLNDGYYKAIRALAKIGDPRAIEPIIAYTTHIIPSVVREQTKIRQLDNLLDAINALGALQSAQACPVILKAYAQLSDVQAEVQRNADKLLAKFNATPQDFVRNLVSAKSQMIDALKKIIITESDSIKPLTTLLGSEQTLYALEIDLELRQEVAHMLISQWSRLNQKQRWLVAIFTEDKSLLSQLRDDTTELVALLSAQSRQITRRASETLEKLGGAGDESQQAILAVARHDWAMAKSLGAVAVYPLIEKLSYPNRNVVLEAVQTLAQIGDSRAITRIEMLLNEENGVSRNPYLLALHQLGWKPTNEADKLRSACLRYDWGELVAMGGIAAHAVWYLLPDIHHSPDILKTLITILNNDIEHVSDDDLKSLSRLKDVEYQCLVRTSEDDIIVVEEYLVEECAIIRKLALDELKKRGISVD